jgi:hypothetical protein
LYILQAKIYNQPTIKASAASAAGANLKRKNTSYRDYPTKAQDKFLQKLNKNRKRDNYEKDIHFFNRSGSYVAAYGSSGFRFFCGSA